MLPRQRPRLLGVVCVLCSLSLRCAAGALSFGEPAFWPQPASASLGKGKLRVSPQFALACHALGPCRGSRTLQAAFNRAVPAVLGVPLLPPVGVRQPKPGALLSVCTVLVASDAPETPGPDSDESYSLRVSADGDCNVTAPTLWGAMHALTTLAQAASGPPGDARMLRGLPLQVDDAPRFHYRGLLLDSARHFLPPSALMRTLDAMAATKLNVLHWHIVDAESFPLALPGFEDLAEAAWHPRAVYRPGDVSAVVEHARARGIRVVPEVDVPGHGAWGRARPELMACDDTLDPTSDAVYAFLTQFLSAVSALFPDPYLFLGGDEVDVQGCWAANAAISDWLAARNQTAAQLQPYFWSRVWTEVLPALSSVRLPGVWLGADDAIPLEGLPAGAFVNTWQGTASLAYATSAGVRAVASGDYYLDTVALPPGCAPPYALHQLWRCFWEADPAEGLNAEQAALVLGAQVSSWGEGVSAATLDARVWARAAAAAERLWSPPLDKSDAADAAEDAADAEERLAAHICRLNHAGVAAAPIRAGFCEPDLEA